MTMAARARSRAWMRTGPTPDTRRVRRSRPYAASPHTAACRTAVTTSLSRLRRLWRSMHGVDHRVEGVGEGFAQPRQGVRPRCINLAHSLIIGENQARIGLPSEPAHGLVRAQAHDANNWIVAVARRQHDDVEERSANAMVLGIQRDHESRLGRLARSRRMQL